MTPNELALAATGYMQKLACEYLVAIEKIAELEAVIAGFSRPVAYPPVAEVPVRDVTHVDMEEDPV